MWWIILLLSLFVNFFFWLLLLFLFVRGCCWYTSWKREKEKEKNKRIKYIFVECSPAKQHYNAVKEGKAARSVYTSVYVW